MMIGFQTDPNYENWELCFAIYIVCKYLDEVTRSQDILSHNGLLFPMFSLGIFLPVLRIAEDVGTIEALLALSFSTYLRMMNYMILSYLIHIGWL